MSPPNNDSRQRGQQQVMNQGYNQSSRSMPPPPQQAPQHRNNHTGTKENSFGGQTTSRRIQQGTNARLPAPVASRPFGTPLASYTPYLLSCSVPLVFFRLSAGAFVSSTPDKRIRRSECIRKYARHSTGSQLEHDTCFNTTSPPR